jgi:hypothetical protein
MLAVIICFYKNIHIIKNLIYFLNGLGVQYDLFIVLNDIDVLITMDKNMYEKNIFFVKGDNTIFEFTGIQKCLNSIDKNKYKSFMLGTDALFNHPIYYLDFINKDMVEYTFTNEVCLGNIDSFNREYKFNNFKLSYWLRTSLIIINKNSFEKIDYQFITLKNMDEEINIDSNLKKILEDWLNKDRYLYLHDKLKIKLFCIYNEYSFTNKIKDICKIYDFIIAYNLNFYKYSLASKNTHFLINNEIYEESKNIKKIKILEPLEQLTLKNKIFQL